MRIEPQHPEPSVNLLFDYLVALAEADPSFRTRLLDRLNKKSVEATVAVGSPAVGPTLSSAIKLYKRKLDGDVRSGELSMVNRNRQIASLSVMSRNLPDQQLEALGYAALADAVAKIKDRQSSGLAPDSIQTAVRDMRLFFGWLEDSGQWKPKFNADRLLRVRKHKLITLSESRKLASGQAVYSPSDLVLLYKAASEEQRLYLLLGLNLAATQQQIADLLITDLNLDHETPNVEFIRGKTRHCGTGTLARYDLWPETVTLLRNRIETTASTSDGWALLTKDGTRLLSWHENGSRRDRILILWKFLLAKIDLPEERKLSFKYLRKTAADMVLRLSDEPTQQLMLAHARRSMAAKHYTGKADFSKLSQTLARVRTELLHEMFGLNQPPETVKDRT